MRTFLKWAGVAVVFLVIGAALSPTKRHDRSTASDDSSQASGSGCDTNYSGACLDPSSPDYDCQGGSGDGPDYTGEVRVVGDDHYDLDRDGDGVGCEPY